MKIQLRLSEGARDHDLWNAVRLDCTSYVVSGLLGDENATPVELQVHPRSSTVIRRGSVLFLCMEDFLHRGRMAETLWNVHKAAHVKEIGISLEGARL